MRASVAVAHRCRVWPQSLWLTGLEGVGSVAVAHRSRRAVASVAVAHRSREGVGSVAVGLQGLDLQPQ